MVASTHNETHRVPGRRLGVRPADPQRLRVARKMSKFLETSTVPAHPAAVDYFNRVPQWLLGRNDQFGTCGPTSVANFALCVSTSLASAPVAFTDDEIIDLYKRSGNPNFDPNTGRGDNGVDMTVMLSEMVRNGIGFGSRNVKMLAYAAINPTDPDILWTVSALFGGVLWGAELTVAQQSQTDQGLWDYVGRSRDWGGHAIFTGGRYSDVAGTANDRTGLITWQEVINATVNFQKAQVQESYVGIWPWHMTSKQFMANVDLDTLAETYEYYTGKSFPAYTPVDPDPEPTPDPTPAGDADAALSAAFDTFSGAVSDWRNSKGS